MIDSIRHTIQRSLQVCSNSSRQEWVAKIPGQAVLCAAQVLWAAGITQAITEGPKALKKYYQDLQVLYIHFISDLLQRTKKIKVF
jgi:hypothetical protein